MPRFDSTLEADEALAQGTILGTGLATLDSDLQTINSDALLPQLPGQPSDPQALATDCQAYGVTIDQSGL